MPNIKSAIKRVQIAERNRLYNKSYRSAVATVMKKVLALADAYEANQEGVTLEQIRETLNVAFSRIDKATQKKVIHKNTAARRKARLARRVSSLTSTTSEPSGGSEVA